MFLVGVDLVNVEFCFLSKVVKLKVMEYVVLGLIELMGLFGGMIVIMLLNFLVKGVVVIIFKNLSIYI